ncbi:hypothetical protein DICSQDRAFT_133746 [Dichomitus squalens LYAD-421 SS1]|uniref:uncharacterized protein n=1 Tax=Dichomitus squalens (strain LYAD-421) TaxID=732165 RepID=UPI0004410882|nr:uncharacterized protein DICSQDRAFT_133746 [Dichomitus squalens LYAD-421 SS1]EJF64042.1 hypothetical protein DICSQDRAFT_133746 [Dichomitus squalens LYAD-421 SS1]
MKRGPKAIPNLATSRPPAAVQVLPFDASTSHARLCAQCFRLLPAKTSSRKCEPCRGKDPDTLSRWKKERARERAAQASMEGTFTVELASEGKTEAPPLRPSADTVEMADAARGTGAPSSGATKRKADALDAKSEASRGAGLFAHKEYQTSQELMDALSRDVEASRPSQAAAPSRPPYVNFRGSFTIVMDPDVQGRPRVKQVVEALAQSAKLRFGKLVKCESDVSRGGHARTYWCCCSPEPEPPKRSAPPAPLSQPTTLAAGPQSSPSPSQTRTPPKRTQSTLIGWLGKPTPKEEVTDAANAPPPGCGGTITVYAVTDFSHPLGRVGIRGQKVSVHVEHPGRDLDQVLA